MQDETAQVSSTGSVVMQDVDESLLVPTWRTV